MHIFVLFVVFGCALAVRPNDEIRLDYFNKSYYIANETYVYVLVPKYQVPLQLYRHIIYTSATENMQGLLRRSIMQHKKRALELAPEDHALLESYIGTDLPSHVKVSNQKRSIAREDGFRTIDLGNGAFVLTNRYAESQKRAGVPLGTSLCLHVPFFTSCDNGNDVDSLKANLTAFMDSVDTEIDSYKDTNNARANEMATVLSQQRSYIAQIAAETTQSATLIRAVANAASVNAAQQAHGDFVAHAQLLAIQRVTNSLTRYARALSSTDARTVVAQPALTELFRGYKALISEIIKNGSIPIVDNRTFDWVASPLPSEVVANRKTVPDDFITMSQLINNLIGLPVVTSSFCSNPSDNVSCTVAVTRGTTASPNGGNQWILGPIHVQHTGIYRVNPFPSQRAFLSVIDTDIRRPLAEGATPSTLYCVDFMGFKVLSTFNSTPDLLNGIPNAPLVSNFSDCNNYLLRSKQSQTDKTWFLFTELEGIFIPFFSNCNSSYFSSQVNATNGNRFGNLFRYKTASKYTFATASEINSSPQAFFTSYHVNAEHYVSANCYINLEPEWIGLNYYFPQNTTVVPAVPRGFKLNQFTINPAGELSSSLEFMYTDTWTTVYDVLRLSRNSVLVKEASYLDKSLTLFDIIGTTVIDASDNFYGASNNGRDCIVKSTTYDYDLTDCFFQNNEKLYSANQYLSGAVRTTGIARYIDKFNFNLTFGDSGNPAYKSNYILTLTAKTDADFEFDIDYDNSGTIIPMLVLSTGGNVSGCFYQFYYTGTGVFTSQVTGETTRNTITFNSQGLSNVLNVRTGGSRTTFYLNGQATNDLLCQVSSNPDLSISYNNQYSTEKNIFSSADAELSNFVNNTVGSTTQNILSNLDVIKKNVEASQQNLSTVISALNLLNFNVTEIVPYENFSDLRTQVRQLVDNIQPSGSKACASGVFGAAGCWFQEALNTVLVIGIIAAVVVGLYCVCCKFGLFAKLMGSSKSEL